jgi:hypothetical protein
MDEPRMNRPRDSSRAKVKMLVPAVVIVGIVAAAYAGYRAHQNADVANQASVFASNFIRSSPIVQSQLGKVEELKKIKEKHLTGQRPGWYLHYDVIGHRASGLVDMRITPNPNYDSWNVPVAQLDVCQKSVGLR